MKTINIKGIEYTTPIYLPDATRGVVKSIDSNDMRAAGIKGAVVNTYHLMSEPGIPTLQEYSGIKQFMGFEGLITSDSGGWQVFSLIHRSKTAGKITDEGVTFSIGGAKKQLFSPEKSIQVQFGINSDIMICLDDFTPPDANDIQIKDTVDRTVLWAKRCKAEYLRIIDEKGLTETTRPHLYAVIQGGYNKELRKECAERLIEIGFDGYGYGGYTIRADGKLDLDISEYIANLIPNDSVRFALGFGKPVDIANLYKLGWDIFDCTLPTRDARHKRLYTFTQDLNETTVFDPKTYGYIYIDKQAYKNDHSPIDMRCDCYTCKNYSRGYINHLFNIKDTTVLRLVTIHNLRSYTRLLEYLVNSDIRK